MHILFLSDNFPPESNAPASRTYEHAREWVASGHEVTVITGAPNFPEGQLMAGYKNRWYAVEDMEGIRVVRVKTWIAANTGTFVRILDYLSFMVAGTFGALLQRRFDVVVATSPQFFTAVAGWLVAALRRRPFVFEVRDLWPASIVAVGAMREGVLLRWMSLLEGFLYRRATVIVVVTEAFAEKIVARGIDRTKIKLVRNGVDALLFAPQPKDAKLIEQFDLGDAFVIGYLGTHGLAHDLPTVLDAVARLADRPDIRFVFVGAGAERVIVERIVHDRALHNVRLVPAQPRSEMPRWLAVCDLCLVPLRDTPLFAKVIPSKLFECMASGTPVVVSVPAGEATALVEENGCGVCVPPGNPEQLAAVIVELETNPARVSELSRAGILASASYTRKAAAMKLLAVLQDCVRPKD